MKSDQVVGKGKASVENDQNKGGSLLRSKKEILYKNLKYRRQKRKDRRSSKVNNCKTKR